MINLLFFFIALFQDQEVPYKPKEEYEVKLNYEFKQRSDVNTTATVTIDYATGQPVQKASGPLPFLTLNIKLIKLPNQEVKIKGITNQAMTILNKKVEEGDVIKMVLGFTADLKDRVTAHEYNLYLLNSDKKEVNRINIFIKQDGAFLVNGEQRGKF